MGCDAALYLLATLAMSSTTSARQKLGEGPVCHLTMPRIGESAVSERCLPAISDDGGAVAVLEQIIADETGDTPAASIIFIDTHDPKAREPVLWMKRIGTPYAEGDLRAGASRLRAINARLKDGGFKAMRKLPLNSKPIPTGDFTLHLKGRGVEARRGGAIVGALVLQPTRDRCYRTCPDCGGNTHKAHVGALYAGGKDRVIVVLAVYENLTDLCEDPVESPWRVLTVPPQ